MALAVIAIGLQTYSSITSRREALNQPTDATCPKGESCNSQGLKAQVRAADAAENAYDLGVLQLIVGAVGIYFVARTLKATRDAVGEANEATKLARAAIEHERQVSDRELRPYIFHEGGALFWLHDGVDRDTISRWRVQISWKNVGQTPAANVRSRANFAVLAAGTTLGDFPFPDRADFVDTVGGVGPAQGFHNTLEIDLADIQSVRAGTHMIAVWAWSEYTGLDPKMRHRNEWHGWLVPLDDPTLKECGFHLRVGELFNGYDESCTHQTKT